jgi:hypothetical protein
MPVNRSKPQQALQLRAEWTAGGGCDGDQWVFQLTHTDRRASDESRFEVPGRGAHMSPENPR